MVPSWANQLLPQLLMELFDALPRQCRHIEHMHEGVWFRKNIFWQNDSSENLDNFSLIWAFVYALMVPSWADQLLPQLLMEQLDTLPIQSRHNEHMHEGVWFWKNIFWQNDSCENLLIDNFSLRQFFANMGFCICIDGAFKGRSTSTTAFDGKIWYFA